MSLSRRQFIRIASTGLAVSLIPLSVQTILSAMAEEKPTLAKANPYAPTPTYCEICFWKCAGWIHKDEKGEPWKITGNEIDQHSYGRLCTRGTGGIGSYIDPDRLKKPMIRTEERGKQVFKEVSWDEALNYASEKLAMIAKKYGPETVALFSHGTGGDLMKTLLKGYGSANITAPSYAQCRGPVGEAFKLTFGEELGNPERLDLKHTRCLVLIGSHLGENLHNSQVQEFSQIIGRGDTIITVDPRFSTAASKSKFWLPIKPATDIALLLAWIHVIINEGLFDKDYIKNNTIGFDELKKHVALLTPEWAYPITGIEPETIRTTARTMAMHAPATLIHPSRHVVWYGDDTQRIRAVAILNALMGNWGQKGGLYLPNKAKVPPYPAPEPHGKASWKELIGDQFPLASQLPANVVRDLTVTYTGREDKNNTDGYFKGWLVYGSNLNQALPDQKKTIEAIQKLELLLVVDTMPAEITGWADVVLPECTYLERYDDLRIAEGREAQIALRAPAFEPKYDSKPGWWIVRELAYRMGLGQYFPWANIEEHLDYRLRQVGTSLDEMKSIGVKNLKANPIYLDPGEKPEFNTPSKKIEFYSKTLEELGFDPLPKFTPHAEPPEGYFRLIYGRTPAHTFTRTTNNPILTQIMDENELWVHPDIAAQWSLKNGKRIKLKNQDGIMSLSIKVKVTERVRPDCVYMAHGFGNTQKQLTKSFGRGASDTGLISQYKVDPIMGGTGFRGNFVTFEKAEG